MKFRPVVVLSSKRSHSLRTAAAYLSIDQDHMNPISHRRFYSYVQKVLMVGVWNAFIPADCTGIPVVGIRDGNAPESTKLMISWTMEKLAGCWKTKIVK